MIVGHVRAVAELSADLPPLVLLHGPRSIGKWTLAEHLRSQYGVHDEDVLREPRLRDDGGERIRYPKVDVESAARIRQHLRIQPIGPLRLVICRIDVTTPRSLETLLKTLEELPPRARVILIATGEVLPTIRTRARLVRMDRLTDAQVARVLEQRRFTPAAAEKLAQHAGGSVAAAIAASTAEQETGRQLVLAALRAIHTQDERALAKLAPTWTDAATELLTLWCQEALSGWWQVFSPEDAAIADPRLPITLLRALRTSVRPRLLVRSTLVNLVRAA